MTLPQEFNLVGRRDALVRLGRDRLDLLIVGGGITGCGIARDAALRGWRVGLVEKEDFAFGTSSRSSKIIHGGVRYLEYGHFLLVRESAQERAVLREIAPHLVHRLPFVFPVFGGESLLKLLLGDVECLPFGVSTARLPILQETFLNQGAARKPHLKVRLQIGGKRVRVEYSIHQGRVGSDEAPRCDVQLIEFCHFCCSSLPSIG